MVVFTTFFTLGVWLLQQQPVLPDFVWAWLLPGFIFALLIPAKPLVLRLVRTLLLAAFSLGLGFYHAAWQAEQRLSTGLSNAWQGRDIEVVGVVAELPRIHEHGQRFRFDVERALTPDADVPHRVYLSTYLSNRNEKIQTPFGLSLSKPASIHPSTGSGRTGLGSAQAGDVPEPLVLKAGERWQLTLRLKQPHGSSNPHGFDFEMWALENDIRAVGYVHNKGNNIRLDQQADGFGYRIESWRETVRDKFNSVLGEAPYAGVLSALAIGDQGSISAAQWQVYTRTGVNHLMSISGLHITMLASLGFAVTYWLWRRSTYLTLRLPARKAAALIALLVALGYALLSGFGVPAQRTVFMVGSVAVALWLNRNFSLGQILAIALLGVLIPDPWAVMSPGFWLSFGAVVLILYVSANRIGTPHWMVQYATVQWAMTIGLIPLLLGLFQQVSLVSPIANAVAIPLVSLIVVPLTLLGAALPLDAPLWLAHTVMGWTMVLLEWLNSLPQAVWMQHAPPAWSIVAGMLGVLLILAPRGFPARWLGILLLLPMFLNTPEPPAHGTVKLVIFDVGQGLAVAAQTRNHALLYDTGPDFSGDTDSGNRILIPTLRAIGIAELDGMILSHDDIDHTGGAASVMQAMPIDWVSSSLPIDNPKTVRPEPVEGWGGFDKLRTNGLVTELAKHQTRPCRDGDNWDWDGIHFELLHPAGEGDATKKSHDNNQSCVLRIGVGDKHILLTADIEKPTEQRLLREHADKLVANLLVVPHHGSKSSSTSEFVVATLPDYAVFTVGYRNRFGHPKQEVLQRYADSGAELLRSDEDGAILVEMDVQGLTVERYRKTHVRYWTHTPSR